MALEEYKFIDTTEKTTEEQIKDLKSSLSELEHAYYRLSQANETETDEMIAIENEILSQRTEYENLGGTYD